MILELKILPEYFNAIKSGQKTFEIRFNNRNYRPGDVLLLKEWNGIFSGKEIFVRITYIIDNFDGIKPGFVIMSIKKIKKKIYISYCDKYFTNSYIFLLYHLTHCQECRQIRKDYEDDHK